MKSRFTEPDIDIWIALKLKVHFSGMLKDKNRTKHETVTKMLISWPKMGFLFQILIEVTTADCASWCD